MSELLKILLNDSEIKSLIIQGERDTFLSQIEPQEVEEGRLEKILRVIFLLINDSYSSSNLDGLNDIKVAYTLLKLIDITNPDHQQLFSKVIGVEGIDNELLYYFYLSAISIKSDRIINVRIDLLDYSASSLTNESDDWFIRVINKTLNAFIFLVRKKDGFSDIRYSLELIESLIQEQKSFEDVYLKGREPSSELHQAYILLGLYHMSKTIVETANYLIAGYDYKKRIDSEIRQHADISKKLLKTEPRLQGIVTIIEDSLKSIAANSIWAKTKFNVRVQKLCRYKAEQANLIDLLPSQRDALNRNLLDVASNVTVLQMPTSSGKTLLAEFNILVTKALKPESKIVYVVPSRALVNQVYCDLKSDFESVDLTVEKASSAIEIDPNEDSFLISENIDILVSTPEKLDLLIRRNHSSVSDVSLFVIDEAHTLQNGERGAKLELLLSLLKRTKADAKYMLLSPFIKDAGETLKEWLGGGVSIKIDWKPAEKLLIGLDVKKRKGADTIHYNIIKSPFSLRDISQEGSFPSQFKLSSSGEKDKILEFSIKKFADSEKTILILCKGKLTANERAQLIYNTIDNQPPNEDIELVRKYILDEVGEEVILTKILRKRICTHHAGLSDETKLLLEHLIRKKLINYVCSTTTIAEGVNFPVSTVFFDSYQKGTGNKITANDFWNIAGRAGRTMIDNFGKIILPYNSKSNIDLAHNLVKESADELVSVLSELFINADLIQNTIIETDAFGNLFKDFSNSLAPLIQYFVHLISIGEHNNYVSQIEDLFKDSLEYYLLDSPEDKQRFIDVCKTIYLHLQKKFGNESNVLSFSDKLGFSIPSVLAIMHEKSQNSIISNIDGWIPSNLFNKNNIDNLTEKIRVIAALRETHIGTESDKAPFNPQAIAEIIIGWVKGDNLFRLSEIHPYYRKMDPDKRINEFVNKMRDISFKSSWGLSALEGIVKGNVTEIKDSFIPSMVYFGVDNERSLALRMIGIPRALSFSLANIFERSINSYSYNDIRKRIKSMTNSEWDIYKPKKSNLNGQEWKRITEILIK